MQQSCAREELGVAVEQFVRRKLDIFVDGAETASRVVKLGVNALRNKAFLFLAPLRESVISDEQLLLVQQHIGNSDRSAIQLAEGSNATVVIRVVVEVILLVAIILILIVILGLILLTALFFWNRNIKSKVFALLLTHDCIVADWCIDLLSICLLRLANLRAVGLSKNSGVSRVLLKYSSANNLVLLLLFLDLHRLQGLSWSLLLSLSLISCMVLQVWLFFSGFVAFISILLIFLICNHFRLFFIDINAIDI